MSISGNYYTIYIGSTVEQFGYYPLSGIPGSWGRTLEGYSKNCVPKRITSDSQED